MKIFSIELEKFRSFRKKQVFKIPKAGLWYLSGINKINEELEANAVGKSTLFEAPYWCFFGKTSLNLKAGQVANWKTPKGCNVTVKCESFGIRHTVFRQWSPNKLFIDGEEVDQETLERKLGITPETFLYSHLFAQFTPSFLDLKPEGKLSLIVDLLRLGMWEKASEVAADQTRSLLDNANNLEGQLAAYESELQHSNLDELREQSAAWKKDMESEFAKRDKEKSKNQFKLRMLEKKLKALPDSKERDKIMVTLATLLETERGHERAAVKLERDILAAKKKTKNCPTCGQPWTQGHSIKEVKNLGDQLKEVESSLAKNAKLIKEAREKLATTDKNHNERKQLEKEQSELEYQIKVDSKWLSEALFEKNPYEVQLQKASKRTTTLRLKINSIKATLKRVTKESTDTEFWIKGFKEVRLIVVQDVLTQLELEVNQMIHALGLNGWEVKFDIEKENKNGGLKRGFTTMVLSPDNKEPVPWEAWSGGERQRLKLAGSMGFSNLINAVTGDSPNFEMWDEPSTWTAQHGIEQMLEALRERAEQNNRTIIVADHRISNYGGFAGRLSIVKDKSGSYLT